MKKDHITKPILVSDYDKNNTREDYILVHGRFYRVAFNTEEHELEIGQ